MVKTGGLETFMGINAGTVAVPPGFPKSERRVIDDSPHCSQHNILPIFHWPFMASSALCAAASAASLLALACAIAWLAASI
jgi:hypothetical protein